MPQLGGSRHPSPSESPGPALGPIFGRRFSEQYSDLARAAIMTNASTNSSNPELESLVNHGANHPTLMPPPKTAFGRAPSNLAPNRQPPHSANAMGQALTDTPAPSAPTSPQM